MTQRRLSGGVSLPNEHQWGSPVSPVLLIIPLSVWKVWFGNSSLIVFPGLLCIIAFFFPTCVTLTPQRATRFCKTPTSLLSAITSLWPPATLKINLGQGCYLALWWTSTDRVADLAVNASERACSGETLLMWLIAGHHIQYLLRLARETAGKQCHSRTAGFSANVAKSLWRNVAFFHVSVRLQVGLDVELIWQVIIFIS